MTVSLVVFEDAIWQQTLPLTYARPTFELTCGMGSLLAKIENLLARSPDIRQNFSSNGHGLPEGHGPALWCRAELTRVLAEERPNPINEPAQGPALFLNGRGWWKTLPGVKEQSSSWVGVVGEEQDVACVFADALLAASLSSDTFLDEDLLLDKLSGLPRRDVSADVELFRWPWEIIHANERALVRDWEEGLGGRFQNLGRVDPGSHVLAPESVSIGRGTRIKPCVVIDAEDGPVWIGEDVTILPHSYIQGPVAIGNGSLIQPGAVIHAGTTIGPVCKVGGEIEASILHGYSNKQHDGFLGHSYVGSWVNVAADCINSDLKNTYGTVRVPINGRPVESGEMFVGMLVGDYSKLGINVSFPTGSVIGFCSSVFAPHSPKFVPSFVWLEGDTWTSFDEDRGAEIAKKVMARRQREFSEDREMLFRRIRRLACKLESYPDQIAARFDHVTDWFVGSESTP